MIEPHEPALLRDEDQFGEAARAMVQQQLAARGIDNARVLEAMRRVPRHQFMHFTLWARAYDDAALPTRHGQTISQPFMVAEMTQLLGVQPGDKVLEIGTGSGYQTTVLAMLGRHVVSIEREAELGEAARLVIAALAVTNVTIHIGDGSLGWPAESLYDRILVTAGAPEVPRALREQLADGGRLVIPVGDRKSQKLLVIDRAGERWTQREATPCRFVPLVGEQGWAKAEQTPR